ncbi:MAG: tyrosine-type recombinase/integrase [Spirochaetia bacterium]|nr:tyrosine-type recombinase/integrase [Spirochaetia bacterium]
MKKLKEKEFKSKLAPYINGLVDEKRKLGYSYNNELLSLWRFDRFLYNSQYDTGILDKGIMDTWFEIESSECINSRKYRIDATIMLAKYMISLGVNAYFPKPIKKQPRPIPYFPDRKDLNKLFSIVDSWVCKPQGRYSHISLEYPLILRMCYCLGLRVSECTNLECHDIDWDRKRILITHSKGDKYRYVYIADDLFMLIEKYHVQMERLFKDRTWFFPGENDSTPISSRTTSKHFRNSWRQLQGRKPNADDGKWPTIHTLRNCFVIHLITKWVEEGRDLDTMIPYLCRHLGHSGIQESYYYFHQIDKQFPALQKFFNATGKLPKEVYDYEKN